MAADRGVMRRAVMALLALLLVRRRSGDGLVFLGLLGLAIAALSTYTEERQYRSKGRGRSFR